MQTIQADSIARPALTERYDERVVDRIVPMVGFLQGLTVALAVLGSYLLVERIRELWPLLSGREEALWSTLRVGAGLALLVVATTRLALDPRWGLLMTPAALLFASAGGASSEVFAPAGCFAGAVLGIYLRVWPKLRHLRRNPEVHVRRLVLPLCSREGSPLERKTASEVLSTIRRRSTLGSLAALVVLLGAATAYGAARYRPSLWPALAEFREAWHAHDREAVAALGTEEDRARLLEQLELLAAEPGWQELGTMSEQEDAGVLLSHTGARLPDARILLRFRNEQPVASGDGLLTCWAYLENRWALVSLARLPRE